MMGGTLRRNNTSTGSGGGGGKFGGSLGATIVTSKTAVGVKEGSLGCFLGKSMGKTHTGASSGLIKPKTEDNRYVMSVAFIYILCLCCVFMKCIVYVLLFCIPHLRSATGSMSSHFMLRPYVV
jgi:hypothetical protein